MDEEKINPLNVMVVMVVATPIVCELIGMLFGRFVLGVVIGVVAVVSGFMLAYERYFNK